MHKTRKEAKQLHVDNLTDRERKERNRAVVEACVDELREIQEARDGHVRYQSWGVYDDGEKEREDGQPMTAHVEVRLKLRDALRGERARSFCIPESRLKRHGSTAEGREKLAREVAKSAARRLEGFEEPDYQEADPRRGSGKSLRGDPDGEDRRMEAFPAHPDTQAETEGGGEPSDAFEEMDQ